MARTIIRDGRELRLDEPPSLLAKSVDLGQTLGRSARAAVTGERVVVDETERRRRLSICRTCPEFEGDRCGSCGCHMPLKTRLAVASCPRRNW